MVLTGRAYGQRATLEIAGDTLTWRARKSGAAENIATTLDEIDSVRWVERRASPGGAVLLLLSIIWMITESLPFGLVALAIAAAMIGYRIARPRRWLALDMRGRWLVLSVDATSAAAASALAARIEQRRLRGETMISPPTLP